MNHKKAEYFEPASPKQQDPPDIATTDDDTTEDSRAEQDRDKGHVEGKEEGTEDDVSSSA